MAAINNINIILERLRAENGGIIEEEYEIVCIGSDAVALFPSLKQIRTGRIIRYRVEESAITLEGLNSNEMGRYIVTNPDKTGDLKDIWEVLPYRSKTGGTAPGMKNKEINGKESDTEISWKFPKKKPSEKPEHKCLVAALQTNDQ